jgi:hypothetical protein
MEDRWNPLAVGEVADRFDSIDVDWWIAVLELANATYHE